ncbi:MAG: lamin tail domain-containing protein [Fibrobacter sp.]|jgi:hypothetical protein|nr:lamin tail domain-containing protein [Fibrobacter sp.]
MKKPLLNYSYIFILIQTLSFLFLFPLTSCSDPKVTNTPKEQQAHSTVYLSAKTLKHTHLDSLVILAVGSDSIKRVLYDFESPLKLELFPNSIWHFYAALYSNGGVLVQKGEVEMELTANEEVFIEIPLRALVGFAYIEIPLGFDNLMDIQKGSLNLSNKNFNQSFNLEKNNEIAYFLSTPLHLNTSYFAKLELRDQNGDTIFVFQDSIEINDENPLFNWNLFSLRSSVELSVLPIEILPQKYYANFPLSKKRTPKKGDIIFTEIYLNTSNPAEFFEIFNGSLDSLILDSCKITGVGSPAAGVVFPENSLLMPSSFLSIGGVDVSDVNMPVEEFNLTNTKRLLSLSCQGTLIDTVFYNSTNTVEEGQVYIEAGKSVQLPLTNWADRADPSKWCLEKPSINKDALCE